MRAMHRVIVLLALVGCYSPSYQEGLLCAPPDDECPPGQRCFSGTCYRSSRDGAPDGVADAEIDAGPCLPGAGKFCLEPSLTVVGDLNAVWGPNATQLWVVGTLGVWSYRSGTWTKESPPGPFEAVHGVSANAVWITGSNGSTWFWNGASWANHSNASTFDMRAVVGVSAAEAFSAGGAIRAWHFTGTPSWQTVSTGLTGDARALTARVVGGNSDVYLGGAEGTNGSLFRFESSVIGWTRVSLSPVPVRAFESMWASPSAVYIAAADATTGAVYRFDETGGPFTNEVTSPARLYAIDGTSDTDVWAVGAQGTVLSRSGTSWNPVTGTGLAALRGVAVFPTRVWVVGDNGRVYSLVR